MKTDIRRQAGFFLLDTIFGFVIAGVLATALVTAIVASGRAQRRLEDGATAMRYAQRVMGTLREGKAAPKNIDDAQVQIERLKDGEIASGRAWVRVVVTYHERSASLIGVTPIGGVE